MDEATEQPIDAVSLLKQDHQKVKKLFQSISETAEKDRRGAKALFDELLGELKVHEKIEEDIFYPAVDARCKEKKVEEMIVESYVEHGYVDKIAADVLKTDIKAEAWPAKVKVMKENVEHHAFEEEEGKLFPIVQKIFSKEELTELGEEMMDLKEETQEKLTAG